MSADHPELETLFDKNKNTAIKRLEKLTRTANRHVIEREQILKECKEWPKVHHEALLLQANLFRISKGMESIEVEDWEQEGKKRILTLDPILKPQDQVANRFRQSKKKRLGEVHAERQLKLAKEKNLLLLERMQILQNIESIEQLEAFCQQHGLLTPKKNEQAKAKKASPAKPYSTYTSTGGLEIWVGKNARANDKMTFKCTKGSDWWFHARDYAGSHVVLRCAKNSEPDDESIKEAAELALRYSKGSSEGKGEVSMTQVKRLSRIAAHPGQVLLSKHKILHIALDEQRWMRLKELKPKNGS